MRQFYRLRALKWRPRKFLKMCNVKHVFASRPPSKHGLLYHGMMCVCTPKSFENNEYLSSRSNLSHEELEAAFFLLS